MNKRNYTTKVYGTLDERVERMYIYLLRRRVQVLADIPITDSLLAECNLGKGYGKWFPSDIDLHEPTHEYAREVYEMITKAKRDARNAYNRDYKEGLENARQRIIQLTPLMDVTIGLVIDGGNGVAKFLSETLLDVLPAEVITRIISHKASITTALRCWAQGEIEKIHAKYPELNEQPTTNPHLPGLPFPQRIP